MKIQPNQLVELTKQQRKGNAIATTLIGLFIVIAIQVLSSFPGNIITNAGWREIYDNSSTIIMIIFILIFCYYIEKRKPETLGFKRKNFINKYILGLIVGAIYILIVFLVNLLSGSLNINVDFSQIKWWFIIFSFGGFMIQGLMEEVVCRGFIMNTISSRFGVITGIIVNSVIFSLLHSFSDAFNWLPALNLFMVGVLFSIIFYYTNSIFVVGGIHTMWNFMVGPILGIEISGLPTYSAVINSTPNSSHSLLNGGAFGIEGGLILTITTLIFIVGVLLVNKKKLTNKL